VVRGTLIKRERASFQTRSKVHPKNLSQNHLGEGDSPILLRGLRKIGTVPDGSGISSKCSEQLRFFFNQALSKYFLSREPQVCASHRIDDQADTHCEVWSKQGMTTLYYRQFKFAVDEAPDT
jgi:hypothetical protein